MSVRLKISLALCALIAIATLSSALNWRFASHQGQLLEGTNEELISSAEKTASLRQMAKDLQLNVVIIQQAISALSSGLAAEDKVIEHQGDQFTRTLSSARQICDELNFTDLSAELVTLEQEFVLFREVSRQVNAAYGRADANAAKTLLPDFENAGDELSILLDTITWQVKLKSAAQATRARQLTTSLNRSAHQLTWTILLISSGSIVLTIVIGLLLHSRILNPLFKIALAMKRLAAGDVNVQLPLIDRGDEVGDLAQALEVFKDSQVGKKSADTLRVILNKMPIGVLLCTADGQIEFANAYARNMFEMRARDGSDIHISQLLPSIAAQQPAELELAEALDQSPYMNAHRLDGRRFKGEVQVSAMGNDRNVWTIRDVTRRVETEENREKLELELRASQKLESLGTMAGGIAHELNTPVQFVTDNMNFLSGALSDQLSALSVYRAQTDPILAAEIDAKYDLEYLATEGPQAIQQSLDGLSRISEIILAVKRFSYPSGSGMRENDLNDIIKTAVTVSRNQWKYIADCELDLEDSLPSVFSDSGELNQMMLNLIVNAAHAIEDLAGSAKGKIKITSRSVAGGVECIVEDTGAGIKPENRDKVFDLFFTTKAPGRGTGQGLSLVHSIVTRKHGGKITLTSEVGYGTEFVIWFPVSKVDCAA